MIRDELAGWLTCMDCYRQGKGGDVPKWLEMFGGRSMIVDRKTGNPKMIYIDRAAVSIAGGIQPETLERVLTDEYRENGLAARLLLACPPRKPKRWTEEEIDQQTEEHIEEIFERLYGLQPNIDSNGNPYPHIYLLSDEAKQAWIKYYTEHASEQAELSGEISAKWSKLEGYTARFALVIHCVRVAANDLTLSDANTIDQVSIEAGTTISRWFGDEARRLQRITSESSSQRQRRKLLDWIQGKGGSITVRQLQNSSRRYKPPGVARHELENLVKLGFGQLVYSKSSPIGGQPSQLFKLKVTPEVYETPTEPNENEGSVDVDSQTNAEIDADDDEWGEA